MTLRNLGLGLLSALAIGFAAPKAQAAILLEPYLGYHTGKYDSGSREYDLSGLNFGARLGYQNLGLQLGLDYMTGAWTVKTDPSLDAEPSDLGLFVGYQFPVMMRVYGVYNLQSKNKAKSSAGSSTLEGSGIKLGVGFTSLPLVAVNLEYRSSTYTKVDGNSLSKNAKDNTYGLTVSLPLTF
ncbi:MAG: outer membrane beta-barrel protein [Bdellovibrionales bacterium]|nr:outer membrane beta-barrel protein [Bdellovibrionales bacterium]